MGYCWWCRQGDCPSRAFGCTWWSTRYEERLPLFTLVLDGSACQYACYDWKAEDRSVLVAETRVGWWIGGLSQIWIGSRELRESSASNGIFCMGICSEVGSTEEFLALANLVSTECSWVSIVGSLLVPGIMVLFHSRIFPTNWQEYWLKIHKMDILATSFFPYRIRGIVAQELSSFVAGMWRSLRSASADTVLHSRHYNTTKYRPQVMYSVIRSEVCVCPCLARYFTESGRSINWRCQSTSGISGRTTKRPP
jgi:hypothetical protein